MRTYRFDEGSIQLASGFTDQTVNTFSLPVSDSEIERQVINVTIARDGKSERADPAAYANEQLVVMARMLPDYELLHRQDIELHGQSTVAIEYAWRPNGREIRQRQTYLRLPTHFLVITLSFAPSQRGLAEVHWPGLLDSLRLS